MQYYRPTDIGDALIWLKDHADDGAVVTAGCTDLFPATTKPRLDGPVLDVTALDKLRGIEEQEDYWRFGAATSWTDIVRAPLPSGFDGLRLAAREVGSVQIQNAATLGGNLCNASPAADGIPCWLTLDASVELQSVRGVRRLSLEAFLLGPRKTELAADEIMTSILVPSSAAVGKSTFLKLGARKYLVISIAMVAARLTVVDAKVGNAAVAVGACSPVAARLRGLEAVLEGQPFNVDLADLISDDLVAGALSPVDDVRGSADYRKSAAAELVRRSIGKLVEAVP